jgi:predicted lactoylglutathione lyase
MTIQFREIVFASHDIEKTKEFYHKLFKGNVPAVHQQFFYTMEDARSNGNMAIVPHNGHKQWDHPWMNLTTDNMKEAISHLQEIGVERNDIRTLWESEDNIEAASAITFKDPDGRLLMMMVDESI